MTTPRLLLAAHALVLALSTGCGGGTPLRGRLYAGPGLPPPAAEAPPRFAAEPQPNRLAEPPIHLPR